MNRLAIVGIVLAVAVGGAALWWFNTGDEVPTEGVEAPAIETTSTTTAAVEETTTTTEAGDPAEIPTLYELNDQSTATFTIDEELRGSPVTVVGVSSIVLGQIQIDPDDLANTQIGTILINARDFTTDSENRNRAIRGPILDTSAVEFIEFTSTSIDGLSGPVQVGTQLEFSVTGDLLIRDITNEVTFDVVASIDDRGFLVGSAETMVLRSDYELSIPSAPGVANVADEIPLFLDFEAVPAS
jgi:polyisoprenoid-binding protein YceI